MSSEVEDAQQQILEVFVSGDHAREVLKVRCELLKLHFVVGLYVVPAPYELSKSLFFLFFVGQHFRVSLSIKDLP